MKPSLLPKLDPQAITNMKRLGLDTELSSTIDPSVMTPSTSERIRRIGLAISMSLLAMLDISCLRFVVAIV